jgi:cell division protein DivIC
MKLITLLRNKTPKLIRNKWALSFLILFTWVLFFEDINLLSLFKTKAKISKLKEEWVFKENRIKQAEEKKTLILSNPEKYARETFWMKRENEEIFILSPENK